MKAAKGRPVPRGGLKRRAGAGVGTESGAASSHGRRQSSIEPTGPPSWWYGALAAVALIGCAAYANGLSGPFVYDDLLTIVQNGSLRHLWSLAVLHPERELPVAGRPLVNVSFAINYALHGLDVRGYHVANIAIHIWNAVLVAGIVRRTAALKAQESAWPARLGAVAAALWVAHPLTSEAVSYVTQRSELLFAWALLVTLYASVRAATAVGSLWSVVAVAACAAGMACKETMAVAPLIVVAYDRVFRFRSWRETVAARGMFYGGLGATWIILAALLATGPRVHSAGFSTGISASTYLLNQARLIPRYLRLSIWPVGLVLNYGEPAPLTIGSVWPQVAALGLLGAASAVALWRGLWQGFLTGWFFALLAPTSSIVPIATEVGAERRMYLPLLAVVLLACAAGLAVWPRLGGAGAPRSAGGLSSWSGPLSGMGLVGAIVVLLVAGTRARNEEYRSALSLATTSFERWPTPVARHMVGTELATLGRHDEALAVMRESVSGYPRGLYDLGVELFNRQDYAEAIDVFGRFIVARPELLEVPMAHVLIARAQIQLNRAGDAVSHLETALRMQPRRTEWHGLLADALFQTGQYDLATTQYEAYLASYPRDTSALTNLGIAKASQGAIDDALQAFTRAVEANPDSASAHRNLANALLEKRRFPDALRHAREGAQRAPLDPGAQDILGLALMANGQAADAVAAFDRAAALAPADPELRAHAVAARQQLGRPSGRPAVAR